MVMMLEVEERYTTMTKHMKIWIEQWSRLLCQPTSNLMWKKNRNLYAMRMLDSVLHKRLDEPFNSIPKQD
jgi:hypothetical protein